MISMNILDAKIHRWNDGGPNDGWMVEHSDKIKKRSEKDELSEHVW